MAINVQYMPTRLTKGQVAITQQNAQLAVWRAKPKYLFPRGFAARLSAPPPKLYFASACTTASYADYNSKQRRTQLCQVAKPEVDQIQIITTSHNTNTIQRSINNQLEQLRSKHLVYFLHGVSSRRLVGSVCILHWIGLGNLERKMIRRNPQAKY